MLEDGANPLFLSWLKEWMDKAQEQNSKGYLIYKKAYLSMRDCPLRFNHPAEAQQLRGLGPKLCDRLADKLKEHCRTNGIPMPEKTTVNKSTTAAKRHASEKDGQEDADQPEPVPVPKKRKVQPYVPKQRSGAYGLLLALSELNRDSDQALSKTDLIEKAQPHCDSSFTAPSDTTKYHTAWDSIKTLQKKELICMRGHPIKRYYLSDEGWEVALRMKVALRGQLAVSAEPDTLNTADCQLQHQATLRTSEDIFDLPDLSPSPESELAASKTRHDSRSDRNIIGHPSGVEGPHALPEPITLEPGTFSVKLVLDTREVRSKTDRDYISEELKKQGVVPRIEALPLGDVLWVAEILPPHDSAFRLKNVGDDETSCTQIVLEHVVERKRLDDLIGSIKDGRFHEQKFRLRRSGMRHVTYLIEDYSMSTEKSEKYGEAVESAIAGMQVVNDIFVKRTSKIDDTIRYLARMTEALRELYESRELHVLPTRQLDVASYLGDLELLRTASPGKPFCLTFSAFCLMCDKSDSMTLRDIFLKMLMCTRGITGDKAIEIQRHWKTPRALVNAYEECHSQGKSKANLISDELADQIPRKKVAKALSAKLAEVWAGDRLA